MGLFHYRRFLNFKTKEKVFHTFGDNFAEKFGLTEAGVLALCRNYDVILPRKCPKGVSLYENYNNEHIAADLDAAVEIIGEKYPAMAETAEEVLRKSNEGYFMNILVTSKTFLTVTALGFLMSWANWNAVFRTMSSGAAIIRSGSTALSPSV